MLLQVVILLSMHPSPSCGSCGCCNIYILLATATSQYIINTHGWQISKSIKSMKFGACTLWRRTASGSGTAAFQESPKNLRSVHPNVASHTPWVTPPTNIHTSDQLNLDKWSIVTIGIDGIDHWLLKGCLYCLSFCNKAMIWMKVF